MLRTFRRHNQTVAAAKSQSTVARIWHSEVGPKTVHFWFVSLFLYALYLEQFLYPCIREIGNTLVREKEGQLANMTLFTIAGLL